MSKIVTGLFMSLDGVVTASDDWQYPYFDEELLADIDAGRDTAGTLLLGRHTYEGYERLRVTQPGSPMLAFLDATPTYVVSSTLEKASHDGVRIIDGDPEQVAQVRRESEGDVLVLGSPMLVRWLLTGGLLDELSVVVLPIVVGDGTRLFEEMPAGRVPLRLAESTALRSGALKLRYTPTDS